VDVKEEGKLVNKMIETTVGRVIFNQVVPNEYGYINQLLTKKSLRDIIGEILKETGTAVTSKFLDDIKNLGFEMAFKGGLSFNLGNVLVPEEKLQLIASANEEVDEVLNNYSMGFITNNERYNQIIDIWTHTNSSLTNILMKKIMNDDQGFNPVYMMLDSGARGSKEQIRQLSGMRGLMANRRNPVRWVVRSSKTRSFPTSRKGCRYSSILSRPTVHVRVWPIPPSRRRMPVTSQGGSLTWPRMSLSMKRTAVHCAA